MQEKKHIKGLDGIRGAAMLMVLLFHLLPLNFQGGFLGVNIFLVLSGFLIYRNHISQSGSDARQEGSLNFYWRRFRRIYPPLFLVVTITVLFIHFCIPDLSVSGGEIRSIFLGGENFWQIKSNLSYFERIANQSPFTHLWSVAVELQFYLIWPFFAAFLNFLRRKSVVFETAALSILTVLSVIWSPLIYRAGVDVSRYYYGTDTRISALFIGVLTAHLLAFYKQRIRNGQFFIQLAAPLLGIAGIICMFRVSGQSAALYRGGMALYSLGAAVVILAVVLSSGGISLLFSITPLRFLGKISYELYLVQYPVLFLFGYYKANSGFRAVSAELFVIGICCAFVYQITHTGLMKKGIQMMTNKKKTRNTNRLFIKKLLLTSVLFSSCLLAGCGFTKYRIERPGHAVIYHSASSDPKRQGKAAAAIDPSDCTFIGDSVMLGASASIQSAFPESTVDAKESRQVRQAIDIVKEHKKNHTLGHNVIIALGTNGPFSTGTGQELVDEIGTDRRIFWVTSFGKHLQWQEQVNDQIQKLAKTNANIHVISWDLFANGNDSWFYQDGIHLNGEGRREYAAFIKHEMGLVR